MRSEKRASGMRTLLNQVAALLASELVRTSPTSLPVGDWGWFNVCLTSDRFKRAHLERIVRNKVDILHLVIMPHENDPAPIFGFDVIALNGRLTGMFLDLTPTVADEPWPLNPVINGPQRPLPDWATFFSRQFVSCVPTKEDVWVGHKILQKYLDRLNPLGAADTDKVKASQQRYTEYQRQNPKTNRMLASIVGPERAEEFIHTVLWPDVILGGSKDG